MGKFSSQIDAFTAKTEERANAVYGTAIEKLGHNILDDTPHVTGFLKASFDSILNGEIPYYTEENESDTADGIAAIGDSEFELNLLGVTINDKAALFFKAIYAGWIENGGEDDDGNVIYEGEKMVALNVQNWDLIVKESANELKQRIQSR